MAFRFYKVSLSPALSVEKISAGRTIVFTFLPGTEKKEKVRIVIGSTAGMHGRGENL
jgi:hypothetical protein